ncbi:hypothetical protein BDZ89DRAFT_1050139 [Hymenopellis radicata]|nr:hypothetical protein BDZ89DRAFT_1050139 [Hymenopellis radicata]
MADQYTEAHFNYIFSHDPKVRANAIKVAETMLLRQPARKDGQLTFVPFDARFEVEGSDGMAYYDCDARVNVAGGGSTSNILDGPPISFQVVVSLAGSVLIQGNFEPRGYHNQALGLLHMERTLLAEYNSQYYVSQAMLPHLTWNWGQGITEITLHCTFGVSPDPENRKQFTLIKRVGNQQPFREVVYKRRDWVCEKCTGACRVHYKWGITDASWNNILDGGCCVNRLTSRDGICSKCRRIRCEHTALEHLELLREHQTPSGNVPQYY